MELNFPQCGNLNCIILLTWWMAFMSQETESASQLKTAQNGLSITSAIGQSSLSSCSNSRGRSNKLHLLLQDFHSILRNTCEMLNITVAIFVKYNLPQHVFQANGSHSRGRERRNEIDNVTRRTLTPPAFFYLLKMKYLK